MALAFTIPLQPKNDEPSPLLSLEHALHPWVAFLVLPMFAFANAGVSLAGLSWSDLLQPVSLGITAGLVVGKTLGVFGCVWAMVRLGWASAPAGASWGQVFGVSVLCGIGSVVGIVLGVVALNQIKQTRQAGYGLAVAGIVVGIATLIISMIWAIYAWR